MTENLAQSIDQLLAGGCSEEALRLAKAKAAQGNPDALMLLATWQLAGHLLPRDRVAAGRWLRAAAQAGHVEAAMMEVALTANGGLDKEADWPAALALLQSAARSGPLARAHLDLVDRMHITHTGLPLEPAERHRLTNDLDAYLLPGFCSAEECRHLAEAAIPVLEPALITDPLTGKVREHPVRTSHAAFLGPTRESLPARAINLRIAAASGTLVTQGEPLVVLHYAPGQQYRPHMDTLPAVTNQRIWTMLVYLNEGYRAGETQFPAIGLSIKGKLGDALLFRNTLSDGQPNPISRHAGLPVVEGRKWIATRWIREHPMSPWERGT
ncbi:2OG-Fe(II) oxygenase [Sandaracinobacteroides hominis]|uniref:2OG-Fe(II) oxygenase n=1 Tax=Sandaracinobacteroides hominis TaxID=2780086 RepID=UPI0018F2F4B7|nr:2OG-Fe(II) oxygenase [Sandaracinobacteroides hominis]